VRKSLYTPTPPSRVKVLKKEYLSKNLIQITFFGEGIDNFPDNCPAAHVKIFIPKEGHSLILPTLSENGPRWPSKAEK
jgi:NADPH-dependent ferric siderophore reductase